MPNFYTLAEAQQYVQENKEEGVDCPCCTQLCKVYPRKIHHRNATNLMQLYGITMRKGDGFYHIDSFGKPLGGGDFAKLRFWGLIEQQPNTDDPSKKDSGMWRITEKGKMFARGEISITSTIYTYLGDPIRESEDVRNIRECLGKKFDFEELMREIVPKPGQQSLI